MPRSPPLPSTTSTTPPSSAISPSCARVGTALVADLDAPADADTLIARANAFPNVALAVRRTILLSRHIRDNPSAAISADAERANAERADAERTDARREIIRTVEDNIERKADPAEAPDLRVELLERLDSPEFELDLRRRTRQDLIQELCRDLGLKISHRLLSPPHSG